MADTTDVDPPVEAQENEEACVELREDLVKTAVNFLENEKACCLISSLLKSKC
jgi:hypothetical protein